MLREAVIMDYNGILPIYKPKGMTSHDVVFKLRKILKMKKIGHTGTLDPEVDGVLVVCLGEGTKLVELLMDGIKGYTGEITLGVATETEDAHGAIVETKAVTTPISHEQIDDAMRCMEGTLTQVPPYYSAVKVNGKKLYEYARANETVERPSRQVQIYAFKRTSDSVYNEEKQVQSWKFDVECGKGTYVRTLAVDLGRALDFPSYMSQLTRYMTGGFSLKDAYTLEDVMQYAQCNQVESIIKPIEAALTTFKQVHIDTTQFDIIKNGQVVGCDFFNEDIVQGEHVVVNYNQKAIALYQAHPTKIGKLKPLKMFVRNGGII